MFRDEGCYLLIHKELMKSERALTNPLTQTPLFAQTPQVYWVAGREADSSAQSSSNNQPVRRVSGVPKNERLMVRFLRSAQMPL